MNIRHTPCSFSKMHRLILRLSACVLAIIVLALPAYADKPPAQVDNQPASSGNTFPDTLQGNRLAGFFEAYNRQDRDLYKQWLLDNRTEQSLAAAPLDARLERFDFDLAAWGGLTITGVSEISPYQWLVTAQPVNGGTARKFQFVMQQQAPHKIGPISISLAIDVPTEWADLQEFTSQLQQRTGVPAYAIGVMRNGEEIDRAASGMRETGGDEVVTINDAFHWGSIAKSVTGTVIGKLVEQGRLNWDTTIEAVLGDIPMRDEYREATLTQLMSHQAGIQPYENFTRDDVERLLSGSSSSGSERRKNLVAEILSEKPFALPGETGRYSNGGIALAGYMAERVSGKSWRELVQEHVFKPAGMHSGGFGWPAAEHRPDQPRGHFGDSPDNYQVQGYEQMSELLSLVAPAGDIRSNVSDMLKYGDMHLRGLRGEDGYLSSETMRRLHTPQPDAVPVAGGMYTFGWGHNECHYFEAEVSCQGHNGGAGSFYAELRLFPEENMVIAYMANAAEPSETIAAEVFEVIYNHYR